MATIGALASKAGGAEGVRLGRTVYGLSVLASLDKANLVIEVQKKLAVLLGLATADDKHGNTR